MNNNGFAKILFRCALYLNSVSFICNSMGYESIFSFCSRAYIIVSVILFTIYLTSAQGINNRQICVLGGLLVVCLVAYVLHRGDIGLYSYIITLLSFFALPMYCLSVPQFEYDEHIFRAIRNSTLITALFFIWKWRFVTEYYYNTNWLTLGFFNPNAAAIYLLQNAVVLLCVSQNSRRKFVYFIIAGMEMYLIYLTSCRTALFCMAVFVLLMLFRYPIARKKWVANIFLFAPILFVALQSILLNKFGTQTSILFMQKELFSGREAMYQYMISDFLRYPILGNFGSYGLGNAHNAYLAVACSIGIIGFLFFYAFYYNAVHEYRQLNGQYLAYVGFLLLFLEASTEAACLVSGSMYAFSTAPLLYLLSCGEIEPSNGAQVSGRPLGR